MSGGYENLPPDGIEHMIRLLEEQDRRIRELEKPSGSQLTGLPQFAVASGSASSIVLNTTYSNVIALSIDVPEGYSQALVTSSAFENFGTNDDAAAIRGFMRISIDGVFGPESNTALLGEDLLRPCFNTTSRVITSGLGSTISVVLQGRNQVGVTTDAIWVWCVANMTATAIFLR